MSLLSLIIKLRLATGLILQCPLYGVLKHLDEGGIREKRGTVAELEINVLGLLALVGPNHGVVAHANSGRRDVAVLIDVGKHMHVLPWILVVGVPLVFLNQEGVGHVFHHGVSLVFHVDRGVGQRADIVFPAYAAHEVAEPLPHLAGAEDVAEERGVMKVKGTERSVYKALCLNIG